MFSKYFRAISVFAICLLLLAFVAANKAKIRIINDDLNRAFLGVTNKSGELITLIPEMYDTSATNATFIFKVPVEDGSGTIYMQRSDFVEPHFPVLSSRYINLMKERKQVLTAALIQDMPGTKGVSLIDLDVDDDNMNEWYKLGLDGWSGEISQPIHWHQPSKSELAISMQTLRDHKLEAIVGKLLQNDRDAHNKHRYSPYNNSMQVKLIDAKTEEFKDEQERNAKIYIARANDPFGYSTSWQLKNSTVHTTTSPLLDDNRLKRDIVTLYSMIKCSTGCDPISYKGYGCYCGFLGSGYPVNGIDTCCKLHDKCYEQSNCISYLEYFVPYIWKCYRGKPLCAIDHGKFGGPNSCAARLCQCDLRLSRCLKQFDCPRQRARCRSSTARQLQNLLFF